ncbi:MAG: hypothetical protein LBH29_01640 [Elusimicrobiota bacterium]|jgi:hypothetical protein|nr:hypothetical protein [Elusimicrobiota bacterium]
MRTKSGKAGMLNPEKIDFEGLLLVNTDWLMQAWGVKTRSGITLKMQQLNIAGNMMRGHKFYPLTKIQAAFMKQYRREV